MEWLWPNGVLCASVGFVAAQSSIRPVYTDAFSTWKNNDEQGVLLKIGEVVFERKIANARCSFQSRLSYELWWFSFFFFQT